MFSTLMFYCKNLKVQKVPTAAHHMFFMYVDDKNQQLCSVGTFFVNNRLCADCKMMYYVDKLHFKPSVSSDLTLSVRLSSLFSHLAISRL